MTFGPASGNVGMYVAQEMLQSVPEEKRPAYLNMVEEISSLKYQLGVEVARQLPRLLAEHDQDVVARYLRQITRVADIGWKSGVEVARQLPDLFDAPDPALAESYIEIVSRATTGTPEDQATADMAAELKHLEHELREMEPKVKRAQELRTELSARDRRDERRRKYAVELAGALPPLLARLRPRYRTVYLNQLERIAQADPEAALEAADTLLDLLNSDRVSEDGAKEWVTEGLGVLERNKEVGRGYFRLGSKYSLEVLEDLREGLALKSVGRVLKLFATALSGRDIAIRGDDDIAGAEVYTSDHIVLPSEIHYFDDDDGNFAAYKVAAAHGAGRIEFGTYLFRLEDIPEVVETLEQRRVEAS